jgi:pimeloyl-ACP methyl ester carboxylesterase
MATHTQQLLNPTPDSGYDALHVAMPVTPIVVGGGHAIPATMFTPRRASGAWVLLVCGAGDNRFAFKHVLIRALLARGLGVVSMDPPGHGEHLHTPTTYATVRHAARAASNWLHAQPGVRRVGALGISFGGCQAAGLTVDDARIAALATIASPVRLEPVTEWKRWREGLQLLQPRNIGLLRYSSPRQILAEWFSIGGARFGESLYDMIARFDMERTIAAVGARPTLFVHGTADIAVPPSNAHRLYSSAQPDKQLVLVRQASHISVVLYRTEMEQVAAWFLEKLA